MLIYVYTCQAQLLPNSFLNPLDPGGMPVSWNGPNSLFSAPRPGQRRGHPDQWSLLRSKEENDDDSGVADDSVSHHIFEERTDTAASGRFRRTSTLIQFLLAGTIFCVHITILVLIWSGKVQVTFVRGATQPTLPPRSKKVYLAKSDFHADKRPSLKSQSTHLLCSVKFLLFRRIQKAQERRLWPCGEI